MTNQQSDNKIGMCQGHQTLLEMSGPPVGQCQQRKHKRQHRMTSKPPPPAVTGITM